MLLYIARHGEPNYQLDRLTPNGQRQAKALADRLVAAHITDVFTSPMGRAQETAAPTAAALGLTPVVLDWAHELTNEERYTPMSDGIWRSVSVLPFMRFREGESNDLSYENAFRNPPIGKSNLRAAQDRVEREAHAWLATLGYRFEPETGVYRVEAPNDRRVAFFCHGAFVRTLLSVLLRIPLNLMWASMGYTLTGLTVVEFRDFGEGITVPQCLCYSDMSHLFAAGESMVYDVFRNGIEI